MALVTWPMLALVGQYIRKRRAVAIGIVISGSSAGGVIWPLAIDRLLTHTQLGFPWTMRVVAFIMAPLLAFSCVAAKSPKLKMSDASSTGTTPVKSSDISTERNARQKLKTGTGELLQQPPFRLLCLAMFFVYFGMFSPFFYITSYAASKGYSTSLAFYTTSVVNGASFFGRILAGVAADRHGKFNCCILATLTSSLVAFCWTRVGSLAGLMTWSAAYGFASGVGRSCNCHAIHSMLTDNGGQGILSLQQACSAQLATPTTIGLAIGGVSGVTSFSYDPPLLSRVKLTDSRHRAMANVPISGHLAAKYGYLALSIFSGASLASGGLLLLAARLTLDRRIRAAV